MASAADKFLSLINAASPLETVRSSSYRWNSATRGGKPSLILQQTISGCGVFRLNKTRYHVPAGAMFVALVPEQSEYFFDPAVADHWTFRWINMSGFCQELWRALRRSYGPVLPPDETMEVTRQLVMLIEDYESGALDSEGAASVVIYNHFVMTLTSLKSDRSSHDEDARRLRKMIDQRFREPVNIKQLTAALGVSREHAVRKFGSAYGVCPSKYLRKRRVETAEALLRFGALSVREVAQRSGFSDARQLSRALRIARGITASHLRRNS